MTEPTEGPLKGGVMDSPDTGWPKCHICGEMLPDQEALAPHLVRHEPVEKWEEGAVSCTKGCGRPFQYHKDWSEHSTRCHGEKPIDASGTEFVILRSKVVPEPVEKQEERLKALQAQTITGGHFEDKKDKKEEEEMAKCGVCGKSFASGKGLGGHMSKAHPGGKRKAKAEVKARAVKAKKRTYTRRATGATGATGSGFQGATGVQGGASAADMNGVMEKLKARADWHRAQAAAIDDQIATFEREAEKFLE